MRSIKRICVLCLAVALAAGLGFAGAAGAKKGKKTKVATKISFQTAGPEGFSGKVKAKGKKGKPCRGQRQVVIYRVNSQASVPSSVPMTITWTNSRGFWSLPQPQNPGVYWAQAKKKALPKKKGKKRTLCRQASSNQLSWG